MTTPLLRPLTRLATLLSFATLATSALALEPFNSDAERAQLRQARGEFVLEDGRVLRVRVGEHILGVRFDDAPMELWRAQNADLLVSPDGRRQLRLLRSTNGSVDRVELHTTQAR
ncbi:hypothetical protein [Roseateles sp.]|uniref:hypothetical protein n=1 Tax=Roseateles sp. TaxID=1971397 RepID=UPI003BA9ACB8